MPRKPKLQQDDSQSVLDRIRQDALLEEDLLEEQASVPTSHEELVKLATEMKESKDEYERLNAEAKQHKDRYDEIRKIQLPDLMRRLKLINAQGKGSFTFAFGRVHLETKLYASCTRANEGLFFDWLRRNGQGDLIRESVNAQTLSALVRERRGESLPDPPGVSTHEETVAKLTK